MTTKEKIIELRKKGLSYGKISKKLNISKSTISYHCKRTGYNDIGLGYDLIKGEMISEIKDYYLNHTIKETSIKFNISKSSVKKYVDNKREIYTEEERKKKKVASVVSWRQRMKRKLVDYKGGKCVICGYNKCMSSLEFHHLDPNEKDFGMSSGIKRWELVKPEIDKCILVCSNCHREIHCGMIEEYKI